MVGMGGVVLKSSRIEPGNIYVGVPVQKKRQNKIGLQRAGITLENLKLIQNEYENNLQNIRCRV
jgi:carbonic anhydrase/acetyltransferase-like protein (isoleucine patch superfamily)